MDGDYGAGTVEIMKMKRPSKFVLILIACAFFGSCFDFVYEWPVSDPDVSSAEAGPIRYSTGLQAGWFMYMTDDIFDYSTLEPGFKLGVHWPYPRLPLGFACWMDFGVVGVAPWFCCLLVGFIRCCYKRQRSKSKSH